MVIRMFGMDIQTTELLEGEQVVVGKAANAVIKQSDYGLERLPYDHLVNRIGFKGKEALGGNLHLTNFRLVFKAHRINRVQGKFSIFLPAITQFRNTSSFLVKRLEIRTELQIFEFVIWGVDEFIRVATNRQLALTNPQKTALQEAARNKPAQFISDTHVSSAVNNMAMNVPEIAKKVAGIATNPLDLSAAISVLEIIEMVFKEE
jgi:hypothetical protein